MEQVETQSSDAVLKVWDDLLTEICGDDPAHKEAIYEAVLADDKVSLVAKNWVKKNFIA